MTEKQFKDLLDTLQRMVDGFEKFGTEMAEFNKLIQKQTSTLEQIASNTKPEGKLRK